MKDLYDVVVIGGGAAGLSGAIALARARRSVLVIDAGHPRNAPAGHVHNYLGREGSPPGELLAAGRADLVGYGGEVTTGTVDRAVAGDGGFRLVMADGRAVEARRLLVATGLVDELPDVPGLAKRWGRDVLHCPYCHGYEVRDQAIGVLATGPMTVHQALLFRQLSTDVTVFRHTGPDLSPDEREQLAARGVPVVEDEVVGLEVTDDQLTGLRLRSGDVVPRQALVVAPRFIARADVLVQLGLHAEPREVNGHVVGAVVPAEPTGATAVPGVWVAGNVTDMNAQVITSAAAGLFVGAQINADLVAEDTRTAVAAYRGSAADGRSPAAPATAPA
jgi:thioredoxin reductase